MTPYRIFDLSCKAVFAIALIVLIFLHQGDKRSLVYVDAQKLMINYKGMQRARVAFEEKSKQWYGRVDTLKAEIAQLESILPNISPARRKESQEYINSKKEVLYNYENTVREKIQNEDKVLTQDVLGRVNSFIKRYGEENGYDIILSATQYGNIAFAKEGLDITDQVLSKLNAEAN